MKNKKQYRFVYPDNLNGNEKKLICSFCSELIISNQTFLRLAIEHRFNVETFGNLRSRHHTGKSFLCYINHDDEEKLPHLTIEKASFLEETIEDYRNGLIDKELLKKFIPHIHM